MFPPRVVARIPFHSWCLRGLPPFRTSPPENLLQGIDDCIGPLISDPSHSSPHACSIISNGMGDPICIHIFLAALQHLVWYSTHQSSAIDFPRRIFTPVDQDVPPKGLVGRLHSVLNRIETLLLPVHRTSQNLEFVFERELVHQSVGGNKNLRSFFSLVRARPPQACWLRSPSPTSPLLQSGRVASVPNFFWIGT